MDPDDGCEFQIIQDVTAIKYPSELLEACCSYVVRLASLYHQQLKIKVIYNE